MLQQHNFTSFLSTGQKHLLSASAVLVQRRAATVCHSAELGVLRFHRLRMRGTDRSQGLRLMCSSSTSHTQCGQIRTALERSHNRQLKSSRLGASPNALTVRVCSVVHRIVKVKQASRARNRCILTEKAACKLQQTAA